ncbi:MAG: excinuclease ABC subunit UvrC [Dehalococcoidia bacterium]|nr:MAG: excinuclease ABC subunit UvrC [Dehalococcoidia bacterium]
MQTTTAERLQAQLAAVPSRPGVYIMRDGEGEVIYVGKAANLRSRIRSYFGSPHSFEPKVRRLVEQIADFEFIVTDSAQEALILEANLVKRHQPFFNVRLKDDKHYPYLKIDLNDPWPRVEITRRVQPDGGIRYFGPYASAGSVRKTLDLVKKLFTWRSCTKAITGKDPRPCLDYYIHRCIAPCSSYCTKEEYDNVIRQVILFLEGRAEEVLKELRQRMQEAAEGWEFEQAAVLRDQIRAVERVTERQAMATTDFIDTDVFGLARQDNQACVQVFFIRATKVIGRDTFTLEGVSDEPEEQVVASFLKQFYQSATYVPKRILLPCQLAEAPLIQTWLSQMRGSKTELVTPQRGKKRRLVAMAEENAREALQMMQARWLADTGKTRAALDELQEELNLPNLPQRIECYDISSIGGTSAVGSMVVFQDGRPRSAEYRRFRIKTVAGADDYAMLQEVLRRRFKRASARGEPVEPRADSDRTRPSAALRTGSGRADEGAVGYDESFGTLPDLVIVDGGKGQLNAALDVMRDLGVADIPAAGLAKQHEELFVQDMSEPIVLPRTSQALYLVQRIRDEAHRFAITYHRGVRQKASARSALDAIPGIGPKRKRALLRKFGSVQRIRQASLDDIAATPGFTRALAERVREGL